MSSTRGSRRSTRPNSTTVTPAPTSPLTMATGPPVSHRRKSSASSPAIGAQHGPTHFYPHSLRDLRTDSTSNFGLMISQKPTALEEQRIQRLIEDKLLQSQQDDDHDDDDDSSGSDEQDDQQRDLQQSEEKSDQTDVDRANRQSEAADTTATTLPNPTLASSSTAPLPHAAKPAAPPPTLPASLPCALPSSIQPSTTSVFSLRDLLPFISHAVNTVIQDDFSRCFQSAHTRSWNWNFYLWPLWAMGVIVRYCILFPLRTLCLITGALIWLFNLALIKTVVPHSKRTEWERWNIRFFCSAFVLSWTGVIRYHGTIAQHRPNQVYVANHTSLIDIVVLMQEHTYSLVGQRQQGFVGFMQRNVLSCLNNCFFDRAEADDRSAAARRIKQHIQSTDNNRLLIFPEGTCVNNEYIVQFKQGAFDMGNAEIIPIAIKYNKIFVDAFWNSRAQAFPMHLLTLMCSWAVVCDVWYLSPQRRREAEGETAIEFSERVKRMIGERAGLKNVSWDGYLKHFRPSARYVKEQQARVASAMMAKYHKIKAVSGGGKKGSEEEEESKEEEDQQEDKAGEKASEAADGQSLEADDASSSETASSRPRRRTTRSSSRM